MSGLPTRWLPLGEIRLGAFPWSGEEFADRDDVRMIRDSIRELGRLDNPLTVRRTGEPDALYEVIAGESRFLAAREVGLDRVPVDIVDVDDLTALVTSLHENRGGRRRPTLVMAWAAARFAQLRESAGLPATPVDVGEVLGLGSTSGWNYTTIGVGLPVDRVRELARATGCELRSVLSLPVRPTLEAVRSQDIGRLEALFDGYGRDGSRGAKTAIETFRATRHQARRGGGRSEGGLQVTFASASAEEQETTTGGHGSGSTVELKLAVDHSRGTAADGVHFVLRAARRACGVVIQRLNLLIRASVAHVHGATEALRVATGRWSR